MKNFLDLGHGYSLDYKNTLYHTTTIKHGKRIGEVQQRAIGHYDTFPKAMKQYADQVIADGIHDGSLKSALDVIKAYDSLSRQISETCRGLRVGH